MNPADPDLIRAAQRGQEHAWDQLVRRHDRWVRGVVYATVGNASAVDDVVQNVWTRVWQQIGSLVEPAAWRSWLYRLAKNAAIDAGREETRRRSPAQGRLRIDGGSDAGEMTAASSVPGRCDPIDGPVEGGDPAQIVAGAEQHRRVLSAIQGLPAIYREPFVLRHMEEWSYAEIGEALDLPEATVETRLVRARRLLREALAEQLAAG